MTRGEALKKMQAVKSYMTSGNPIWSVTEIGEAFDMAIEALEQPEIIRCKDCKYYEIAWLKKDFTDDKRYKPSICVNGRYGITRKPDWFCADAERRTDENN